MLPPLLEHSQAEQDLRKTGMSCVFRSRSRAAVSECSRGWFLPKPPTRPLTLHFLPPHQLSSGKAVWTTGRFSSLEVRNPTPVHTRQCLPLSGPQFTCLCYKGVG